MMGKMIDIDSFYKRYMFHATCKAEAEFNQIINEIKKTEVVPEANDEIHSDSNYSERMTFDEAIETIKGNKWIACQEKYQEAMNLIETTINKYQKIEKIVENRDGEPSIAILYLNKIIEVVENENDN